MGFTVKINAVVMANRNIEDIIPFVRLTKNQQIAVRFIEEMPFNGSEKETSAEYWNYVKILEHIFEQFPKYNKLQDGPFSTSMNYRVQGHQGTFGVIPAYSRTFCGSCNRIRITPVGILKTCLYDKGVFNIRDLMRKGASDHEIGEAIISACSHRAKDGFEAEQGARSQSHF